MKNHSVTLFSFLLLLLPISLLAQKLPEIIPPSPTVASLMHFEEVPIDYYSGQPDIQIPIFSKNLGSGITIPITLRYSTMGLRVEERSGWAGTGWALDGEAVVSRTVRGIADDANGYDSINGKYLYGVYHNGFFDIDFSSISANLQSQTVQNFLWNASGRGSGAYDNFGGQSNGDYDKELDLYQVSLFGRSARFIIVKNTNDDLEVKMLNNDNNLKVVITYNPTSYAISSFTVIDTQGNQYIMDETEITTSISSSGTILQNGSDGGISSSRNTQISAWKVREIKNSGNELLTTYFYQNVDEKYNLPVSYSEYEIKSVSGNGFGFDSYLCSDYNACTDTFGYKAYNATVSKPKKVVSISSVEIQSKKIDSILFRDKSSVHFGLDIGNHPEYNSSGKKLKEILIKDISNNRSKRFEFVYSINSPNNNRLFLDEVIEHFKTDADFYKYKLDYESKYLLTGPSLITSNTSSKSDLWGYYKGTHPPNSPLTYNFNKSADKDAVDTGVLKSITYPTGGKKEFVFESNTFSHMGSRAFTAHEFKLYNQDNWIQANTYVRLNNTNDGTPSTIETQPFDIADEHIVHFIPSFEIGSYNNGTTSNFLSGIGISLYALDANNNELNEVDVFSFLEDKTITIQPGRYKMKYISLNNPQNNDPDIKILGTLYYNNFKTNYDEIIFGGGIRLKSSIFRDYDNSIQKQVDYDYTVSEGQSIQQNTSTGVIDGFLTNVKEYSLNTAHMYMNIIGGINNTTVSNIINTNVTYDVKEYLNSAYVSMTKNNYVGYRKVTKKETRKETGNGRTVFEFSSPEDSPTYPGNPMFPDALPGWPFLPNKDQSHLHGALTSQKVYDSNNRILNEVTNSYGSPIEIPQATWLYTYDETCAWAGLYRTYSDYLAHFPSHGAPPGYEYASASTFENCISNSGYEAAVFTHVEDYFFTKYLLDSTTTKDYVYDINNNQSVIEKRQEFKYNTTNYQISEQDIYYDEASSEQNIKIKYFYPVDRQLNCNSTSVVTALIDLNKVNEVLETQTFKNGEKLNETYNIYHPFEPNLLLPKEIKVGKKLDSPETRVEFHDYDGYGNPLEVSKTDGTHIIYVWGYNNTQPIAKIENATYAGMSSALKNIINTAKTASNNDNDNCRAIGCKEQDLRDALENLRNHPEFSNAMISSYTYDPLIGVTSMTDPRGYTMYYEYDSFNRLKQVRDQDENILSENQYNYRQPQN